MGTYESKLENSHINSSTFPVQKLQEKSCTNSPNHNIGVLQFEDGKMKPHPPSSPSSGALPHVRRKFTKDDMYHEAARAKHNTSTRVMHEVQAASGNKQSQKILEMRQKDEEYSARIDEASGSEDHAKWETRYGVLSKVAPAKFLKAAAKRSQAEEYEEHGKAHDTYAEEHLDDEEYHVHKASAKEKFAQAALAKKQATQTSLSTFGAMSSVFNVQGQVNRKVSERDDATAKKMAAQEDLESYRERQKNQEAIKLPELTEGQKMKRGII
jgi:hypothetical protein